MCDYENPWIYLERPFTSDLILDNFEALFISLPISPTNDSTLGGKFSGFIENLLERNEESNKRVIGKRYYGSCDELKEDVKLLGTHMFKREILSLHKTKGKTNFETEALFKNNVLTESMEDGSPLYYNSNIMNRYYRKDYFTGLTEE